jgi:hypothetical protein
MTDKNAFSKQKEREVNPMYQTLSNAVNQSKCSFILAIVILIFAVSVPPVAAEENLQEKNGWKFHAAPYLWAISMEGDAVISGHKSEIDTSFSDIWKELNIAGMVNFEGSKDRWGFYGDVIYSHLGKDKSVQGIKIEPTVKLAMLMAGGSYQLGKWRPSGNAGKDRPTVTFYALLGGRYTYLDIRADIKKFKNASGDEGWLDPLIGTRIIFDLSERWELGLQGNIGGFGVGSDFTWEAHGDIGYRLSLFSKKNNGRFVVGYRALYQDYSNGSGDNKFEWDVTMHGPVIGMVIEF